MPDMKQVEAVVVGAGFCGTATAAGLTRYGVEKTVLLEAGRHYGQFWVGNYDRITLHSPWHDLPDDGGIVDDYPMYKSKAQLLEYFERYAERHHLREVTHFEERVTSATRDSGDRDHPWRLVSDRDTYHARYLVVCTGSSRSPHEPSIPGRDRFGGTVIHSRDFRNGEPFRGQRVLVVGSGNSACEQATDLVDHGAEVTLLIHGPRYLIPLDRMAEALHEARPLGMAGPEGVLRIHPLTPGTDAYREELAQTDEMMLPLVEDLSSFGFEKPSNGPFHEMLVAWRVPVLDQGSIPLIRSGQIEVVRDRLESFTERGVCLRDHRERDFDAVVLATGFRPGLSDFLPDEALYGTSAPHGMVFPRTDGRCRSTVHSDLFFVGYDMSLWGGASHGNWGFEVAEKIATETGSFRPELRPPEYKCSPWLAAP